ncbi:MAG: DNA polymerase I [Bacteroidales bacterium]|nr:DNA polymerase I [Bacteroidales bacterium]
MQNRAFLVDAYALVYRAYFAFIKSPMMNSKRQNISAFFGFASQLIDLVLKQQPSHVAVAFDLHGPTFRHDLFPDYKANRDAQPEDITFAIPLVKRLVAALNIPCLSAQGFEADDVVGTAARRLLAAGIPVTMVSPDKDYAQLVTDGISLLRPRSGGATELLDVNGVAEKFSVQNPSQVIDLLGLWGDSSDNIPGCPGIGEKRAKELIAAYGSIEGIYEHISELKGKMKERFEENKDLVLLSKKLATIVTDAPLDFSPDDLLLRQPDWSAVDAIMKETEVKALTPRLHSAYGVSAPTEPNLFNLTPAAPQAPQPPQPDVELESIASRPHNYILADTDDDIRALADRLSGCSAFCFDTETTGVDVFDSSLVGLSVAIEEGTAWYVPLFGKAERLEFFRPVFENSSIMKIGQNIKFDMMMLAAAGVHVRGELFDTMIAHFLLHPSQKHNMDDMAESLLHYKTVHIDELIGKGLLQLTMDKVDVNRVKDYAAEDADVTLRLYNVLRPLLEANPDLWRIFREIESPLIPVLADMEMTGVRIDTDALARYADYLQKEISASEQKIWQLAGVNFNVASPKQVGDVLFDRLKIDEKAKKTKTGAYSTDEASLAKLAHKHPVVGEILNYRGLVKLLNTYAEALPKLVSRKTGRLHTSFNQAVVVTGRLSSSNPNLQNIPVREEQGKRIRECFVPSPGNKIVSADYSQVELRLMAHLSGDKALIDAFLNGEDVHRATAAKVYNVSPEDVSREQRSKAKTANFGIIYGISAFGLAERLDISRAEAKELIDGYFASFPAVKVYMDKAVADVRESGIARTLMGRIRELPDINSRNATIRGIAERNAINAPIQGTAADIIKIAMIRVHDALMAHNLRAKIILQVHDELVLDVPAEEVDEVSAILKSEMENAAHLSVPLTAEVGIGDNWLEAH